MKPLTVEDCCKLDQHKDNPFYTNPPNRPLRYNTCRFCYQLYARFQRGKIGSFYNLFKIKHYKSQGFSVLALFMFITILNLQKAGDIWFAIKVKL